MSFSEDQFLRLGFESQGDFGYTKSKRDSQIQRFRSLYGTSPLVLSMIWTDIHESLGPSNVAQGTNPLYMLVLYRWLKSYATEFELQSMFMGMAVKTIRKWVNILLENVALLRVQKIDAHWPDTSGLLRGRTVDCIHYRVDEPRPFSKSNGSYKYGGKAALSYEFCIDTLQQRIVWINGPFPAGKGDLSIFETRLKEAIEALRESRNEDIKVIADDGYIKHALLHVLALRNEFDPHDIAYFKDRALSRHESFNGHTKRFGCLSQPFRHDHTSGNTNLEFPKHKLCVEAICVTLQYELEVGDLRLLDPYPC